MNAQTYLFFDGSCEEAIELYSRVFGASVEFLMKYGASPVKPIPAGWEEKVFHATLKFGDTALNMSDSLPTEHAEFGGFALLAHMDSEVEAERVFAALQDGGEVRMPLQTTFWAPRYGIIKDRFGVTWKVQA